MQKLVIEQFRIRPEYKPESPEPQISGDLGIAATKSHESLHGGSFVVRLSWNMQKLGSISFGSDPNMSPNRQNH